MASSSTPPPDDNDHATATGVRPLSGPSPFAMCLAGDFTPTTEGRARYEQNMRDMVYASEQTEARVRQMRERERFFGPMVPGSDEDEREQQRRQQSNTVALENDRRCAEWNRAVDDDGMSADAPPGPKDKQAIAAFLASDRSKAVSKQMAEFYAEEAVIETRMRATLMGNAHSRPLSDAYLIDPDGGGRSAMASFLEDAEVENRTRAAVVENMHRYRPVLAPGARVSLVAGTTHPIDPNGGGRGSGYVMSDGAPFFFRPATKAELRRQAEANAAFAHPDSRDPAAIVAAGAPNRLPEQHARDVRAEKMAHIEQCIKIVGDSTINAFDHVRIGRMIAGLVGRMERGELGPDECERLHTISTSYDRLVVTFVSPLHHRRGRPRKQARTHRRGKPDVRMAPTSVDPSEASDRSRMDAQPRPKKGAWPTFYCKRCPINGRATANELPYGTLSRDVLCDTCAVQMHAGDAFAQTVAPIAAAYAVASSSGFSRTDEEMAFHETIRQAGEEAREAAAAAAQPDSPRPPMVIHPNGNVENYDDHAYLKACLPLIYGPDWERMSNAVIAGFHAQATAAAVSQPAPNDDEHQQRMAFVAGRIPARFINGEWMTIDPTHAMEVHPVIRERETVGAIAKCRTQTAAAATAASYPTPEREALDAECAAAMQAAIAEFEREGWNGSQSRGGVSSMTGRAEELD